MLEPTGERVIEEHYRGSAEDYLIYLFHIVTYDFAMPIVHGARVLDFGCGSGYGTARIASGCDAVIGVDISQDAIAFAGSRYHSENLSYRVVEPVEKAPLPFNDNSFDCVLSFQVIEHVIDPDAYLWEVLRVLRPGGKFIIATPDRSTRS